MNYNYRYMKKNKKLVKRILTIILVIIMSLQSLGAVVSDNDGSAFITKAEFDSLKNNFQSQIDQYNTSIDNKIDDAIASYLAGISVAKTETKKLVVSEWDEYTLMNGVLANTWAYPDMNALCTVVNTHVNNETSGSEETTGNRKVAWGEASFNRQYSGTRAKRNIVTNVSIGTTLDTSNMTWYGQAQSLRESWDLAVSYYSTSDPGYIVTGPSNNDLQIRGVVDLTGRTGYIESYSDTSKPLWKPYWAWLFRTDWSTSGSPTNVTIWSKSILSLAESATVSYDAVDGKSFKYEHIGTWFYDNLWEVGVKDCLNYLTTSPNNTYNTNGIYNGLSKSCTWSAIEVGAGNTMTGFKKNRTGSTSNGRGSALSPTDVTEAWPSIGLLSGTFRSDRIKQFDNLVNEKGEKIESRYLQEGIPIMQVKKGEKLEWEPNFSSCTVPEATGNVECVVVLSYKPFTNGRMTYYEPGTQDINDYVKIDGFERGIFPVTTSRKVKIKFESEHDGYIYAKWFPNVSDSDIESKEWEATLDLQNCNTYKSTKE